MCPTRQAVAPVSLLKVQNLQQDSRPAEIFSSSCFTFVFEGHRVVHIYGMQYDISIQLHVIQWSSQGVQEPCMIWGHIQVLKSPVYPAVTMSKYVNIHIVSIVFSEHPLRDEEVPAGLTKHFPEEPRKKKLVRSHSSNPKAVFGHFLRCLVTAQRWALEKEILPQYFNGPDIFRCCRRNTAKILVFITVWSQRKGNPHFCSQILFWKNCILHQIQFTSFTDIKMLIKPDWVLFI